MRRLCLFLLPLALFAQRKPIILDLSVGDSADSAMALFTAVSAPSLDLKAVSTVSGDSDARVKLALKVLTTMAKRNVPVGWGAPEPLDGAIAPKRSRQFEALVATDSVPEPTKRSAVLILDTLASAAARSVIVAPDALTNIAMALKLDPRVKPRIELIVATEEGEKLDPQATAIVKKSGVAYVALAEHNCKLDDEILARLRAGTLPHTIFLSRLIDLDPAPVLRTTAAVAYAMRSSVAEQVPGQTSLRVNCTPLLPLIASLVR